MENLLIISILSAILISYITSSLGCFVIWNKMAYFGDSLAHSALLGVAFGLLFSLDFNLSLIIVTLSFSLILIYLNEKKIVSTDTSLGILAHSTIALAIFLLDLSKLQNIDLESLLFGNINSVNLNQLIIISISSIITSIILYLNWSKLVLISINKEIAISKGINVVKEKTILTLLIALSVAISIKLVGVLLVSSLLIIPAATAKQISSSPKKMLLSSLLIGIISSILGILLSLKIDVSTGPSIVIILTMFFIFSVCYKK